MEIKVTVPVKPLVKHYLQLNFGEHIYLSQNSVVGKYFLSLLNKKSHLQDHQYNGGYSEQVVVNFAEWYMVKSGHILTSTAILHFNNFVTELVYELMCMSVKIERQCSKTADLTIEQLQKYKKDLRAQLNSTSDKSTINELRDKIRELNGVIKRQQLEDRFEVKKAIMAFMERFNITESIIKYDTAEKAYLRRKKRSEKFIKNFGEKCLSV